MRASKNPYRLEPLGLFSGEEALFRVVLAVGGLVTGTVLLVPEVG